MPENNEIELRSEEVQEILTRVPHWMIRWGNIIVLIILLVMMMFSYFMKYPDILTTQVVITTQNPPEKLVARTTGKIAKILVEDRVEVEPKTPLAIIENTANYNDVFQLIACVDTISINKAQFNFPFDKLNILQLGEIQNAFTIFEKDYIAYDLNRDLKPYSIE